MYLLDTCAFIWALKDDSKLPEKVKEVMANNKIYLSQATFWEIAIKQSIHKLDVITETLFELQEICDNSDITILPLETAYMERIKTLPLIHLDPFDRIIIATAALENLTVITADAKIAKYEEVKCLWEDIKEDQ
ncbi:MAG: type II toxin-antitoxin system VapC family toxin [Synergistaceae bacterium]|nr:type II toxin-antitoxin system VapC family toxin [Synergistaceae bacterium]